MSFDVHLGLTRDIELNERGSMNVACSIDFMLEREEPNDVKMHIELLRQAFLACHDAAVEHLDPNAECSGAGRLSAKS